MEYQAKTDAELEQLAQDMEAGRLWTSYHGEGWKDSFMVLHLMSPEQLEELRALDVTFFYEYVDQAGPRGINGQPSFFSIKYLNRADHEKFHGRFVEIHEYNQARLAAALTESAQKNE